MHTIKTQLCRRKFSHSDIVEYSLQNEVLLFLRIPEEMICFSAQHICSTLTDLVVYCMKVTLFFSTGKYLRNFLMMLLWKKNTYMIFIFVFRELLLISFLLAYLTNKPGP